MRCSVAVATRNHGRSLITLKLMLFVCLGGTRRPVSELGDALRELWARGDLRSLNAQIEFLLRRALLESGRLGTAPASREASGDPAGGREEC